MSPQMQWRLFSISLIVCDVVMVAGAFWTAYLLRFVTAIPIFQTEFMPDPQFYLILVLILVPSWLVLFTANGLYDRHDLLGGTREYSRIFRATTLGILLVVVFGFLMPGFIIARGWLMLAWGLVFVFAAAGRFAARRIVYFFRQRGYFLSRTIIVGGNAEGRSLAEQLLAWPKSGLHLIGFVDEKVSAGTPLYRNLCSLGTADELDAIIEHYGVEELILASSAISSREKMLDIFKRYGVGSDVNVRMSSGLYEIITTGLTVKEFAYVPLVGVNKVRLTGFDWVLKLVLDYGLSIPLVILMAPFLLLIALAVKLDSPGPIIYRRRVMGVNGTQFDAFKFRTMHVNGDAILDAHPAAKLELAKTHKLKVDPRITRVGRWLRRFSLDELPQIFNVLRREMSLVGPRMISPPEMEEYRQWGINLLTVPPGITGLWQVSGRSDVSYEGRVRMDMFYVRNWSIWLDFQLIINTIPAILGGRGAY